MVTPAFNEPLNEEPDGTYITVGQMRFFLNRKNGKQKFFGRDPEFVDYYNLCRVYNVISDIMAEDEEAAIMYWDDKKKIISMGYPNEGSVSKALSGVEPHASEYRNDNEDYDWDLFD